MAKTDDVLRSVLRKIRPSKEQRQRTEYFSAELMNAVTKISKPYSVKPMLCGSTAKNTWLPDKNELDLFLMFSPLTQRKKLEEQGLEIARMLTEAMKGTHQKKYAEHPYLCSKIKFGGTLFDVDIVPCYDMKDLKKIKTAVDRTPHHVRFVKKSLLIPDEVRLLKQFMKAAGCYGADVRTNGFSGYLCELLVINYGKFNNCIKAAAKWRAPAVISLSGMKRDLILKKFKAPFVFIDPVDKNRNVAAAVSAESFYKFVDAANAFIDNPSEKFFSTQIKKPYTMSEIMQEIKNRGTRWYMISFERPDVVDDTLYPQVKRCMNSIETMMTGSGFRVLRKDFWIGKQCVLVFEMDVWMTPRISKNIGPNIYTKHAEDFLKHYKERKIFIEGENWIVELDRTHTTVLHLLKDLAESSEAKLKEKGIPNKIVSNFRKSKIVSGSDAYNLMKTLPEEFKVFMRNWFERDIDIV